MHDAFHFENNQDREYGGKHVGHLWEDIEILSTYPGEYMMNFPMKTSAGAPGGGAGEVIYAKKVG